MVVCVPLLRYPSLVLTFRKASDDWPGCLFLHNMGDLASSLLEWPTGRVQLDMAFSVVLTRDHPHKRRERLSPRGTI